MASELLYIPNGDIQNYPICRLQFVDETFDIQLNEPASQNSIKVPKVIRLMNKKTLL